MPPKGLNEYFKNELYSIYSSYNNYDKYIVQEIEKLEEYMQGYSSSDIPSDVNINFVPNGAHFTKSYIEGMKNLAEILTRDQLYDFLYSTVKVYSQTTARPVKVQFYGLRMPQLQAILNEYIKFCERNTVY